MKVLLIGDIVGSNGVKKVMDVVPKYKEENNIDFVVANGENSAEGMGITKKIFDNLINAGVNVITMGNHTWGKRDIFEFINDEHIVRPANYSAGVPGTGYRIHECNGKKIAVINLIGRVDVGVLSENPFTKADQLIRKIKADIILVDFHAEATAEKIALGYYLDGKVTCVFGTHTHVQTADETILGWGTGYITDIGMTGPKRSVIGMDIEASIKRFLTSFPERYRVSPDEEIILSGCVLDINDETCKIESINRIKL